MSARALIRGGTPLAKAQPLTISGGSPQLHVAITLYNCRDNMVGVNMGSLNGGSISVVTLGELRLGPAIADDMSRRTRSESTPYLSDRHVNLIEGDGFGHPHR